MVGYMQVQTQCESTMAGGETAGVEHTHQAILQLYACYIGQIVELQLLPDKRLHLLTQRFHILPKRIKAVQFRVVLDKMTLKKDEI